ncbi:MAG: VOC family protein [Dehalococcoidia bacterium]|nr:VOC family protein [Dehalococcoidia bacterium]
MNHTIIHFEIPANDPEKLAAFYRSLFNWKIEKNPGPMEYWLLQTAPEGQGVNGGMMRRQMPGQAPTNYFNVESVDDYSRHVLELGGQVVAPKQEVPDMGFFAVCLDPEGNCFAVWEDKAQ